MLAMVPMWCLSTRPPRPPPRAAIATAPGDSATLKPSAVTVTDCTAPTSDSKTWRPWLPSWSAPPARAGAVRCARHWPELALSDRRSLDPQHLA